LSDDIRDVKYISLEQRIKSKPWEMKGEWKVC